MMIKKEFVWMVFLMMILLAACGTKSFNIAGRVIDAQGNGLSGVTLIFSGGRSGSVETGDDGQWQITGLKGSVTIQPQKTGWVFQPEKKVVQSTTKNLIFTGNDGNDALIIKTLEQYCQVFNQEDAKRLVDFFHPDYYIMRGITEIEHLAELEDRFLVEDWIVSKKATEKLVIDQQIAEVSLLLEVEIESNKLDYLWEFSLVQEGTKWLIADWHEIEYQAYLERPYIEELVTDFLDALKAEDLSAIAKMTSNDYFNFQHGDKTGFLDYLSDLMQRVDIFSYVEKLETLNIYEKDKLFAKVTVFADICTDGITDERKLKCDFNLVQEENSWMLLSLHLQADEILIFQRDIVETNGQTELIEFAIQVFGEHNIRTRFLEIDCDTELILFDSQKQIIAKDDDSGEGDYSLINADLDVGTYYVQISEYDGKNLSCRLEISRLGL